MALLHQQHLSLLLNYALSDGFAAPTAFVFTT
jgi:hypothetical protein